ncbi:MAG: hypothetical protein WCL49_08765 [bacterium]
MYLFMISMLVVFLIIGAGVLVLGKRAKSVRVSEIWKLFFGLILVGVGKGMSDTDVSLRIPKLGFLLVGGILVVWFVVALIRQWRKRTAEQTSPT